MALQGRWEDGDHKAVSLLWALPHLMQPAPETQDQDFLRTSRVIPAPSLAHEPKAEFLLCSLQFGLQGCLLSFLNGHLSPDQSHEVVLYLAVNTTYVCSFSRLKNRLANNSYECLKEGKVLSNDDFCLLSSFPCFICKVFFSLVLCFQDCLPSSSDTLQLLAVFAFFFGAYILI